MTGFSPMVTKGDIRRQSNRMCVCYVPNERIRESLEPCLNAPGSQKCLLDKWFNTPSPLNLMWRQRSKKSETTPGMQQRTWSTAGTPNKSENWVKCKQNDKICQRSPCMFLFERWSIFYYFSNLVLEFWKQFKNRHSWDVTVISSDTSHTLKLFFFFEMSVLEMNLFSLFKGWKQAPFYLSIPLTNVKQKHFQDLTYNQNAASNPISLLILLNFSKKEINQCASIFIWEQYRLKTQCWYGEVSWQTLTLSAIYTLAPAAWYSVHLS